MQDVLNVHVSTLQAVDGVGAQTAMQVHAAAKDSVRAFMLIRAYRIRGHLAANLDKAP